MFAFLLFLEIPTIRILLYDPKNFLSWLCSLLWWRKRGCWIHSFRKKLFYNYKSIKVPIFMLAGVKTYLVCWPIYLPVGSRAGVSSDTSSCRPRAVILFFSGPWAGSEKVKLCKLMFVSPLARARWETVCSLPKLLLGSKRSLSKMPKVAARPRLRSKSILEDSRFSGFSWAWIWNNNRCKLFFPVKIWGLPRRHF